MCRRALMGSTDLLGATYVIVQNKIFNLIPRVLSFPPSYLEGQREDPANEVVKIFWFVAQDTFSWVACARSSYTRVQRAKETGEREWQTSSTLLPSPCFSGSSSHAQPITARMGY